MEFPTQGPIERWKDSVLFCIDCSSSMVQSGWLTLALSAVCNTIKSSTLLQPNQDSGVIVYNLQDSHAEILLDLKPPNTTEIKKLLRLSEDASFRQSSLPPNPTSQTLSSLPRCLELAIEQFDKVVRASYRRLVIITDSDSPVTPEGRTAASTRFQDLVGRDVRIVPVFLQDDNAPQFDPRDFWETVRLSSVSRNNDFQTFSRSQLEESGLTGIVESRARRQHTSFKARLSLAGNLELGVSGYSIYQQKSVPPAKKIFVDGDKETLLETTTIYTDAETASVIDPKNMQLAFTWGDHKVEKKDRDFIAASKEMISQLHKFDDYPTIRILCFRRSNARPKLGYRHHSLFIKPTENPLEGSTEAFACLRRSMIRKKVTAVVTATLRKSDTPRMGYLYASSEPGLGRAGMYLVLLPYLEEYRELPDGEFRDTAAGSDVIEAMGALVNKLPRIPAYDPSVYPNRRLEYYNNMLQATALSIPVQGDGFGADTTLPDYSKWPSQATEAYSKFVEVLNNAAESVEQSASKEIMAMNQPKKQPFGKPTGTEEADVLKHLANADKHLGPDSSYGDILQAYRPLFKDYTIAELRLMIKAVGNAVASTKRKDDLIDILASRYAEQKKMEIEDSCVNKRIKTE